jgi:autotransporter-associated beta strand protein/T5SS/PEP-CTERM-associated repeat protein
MKKKLVSVLSLMAAVSMTQAADRSWIGGTADYTNAADWTGGVVPGAADNAINDHGTNNAVQISVGNPDWLVGQIRAGNGAGDGAFIQNGQAVSLIGTNSGNGFITPFGLGIADGNTGIYTLNGGSINYSNGGFNVGELGTGILNINGGSITGSGVLAVNLGVAAIPAAVNATVGGGTAESDFTWFEQGLSPANPSIGLPAAGTTIVSMSQADHSYALPPSYTANNAVLLSATVPTATVTMTAPAPVTGLSFLGTAGNGPVGINYVVHHADSTTETGSLSMPDWFGPGTAAEVMAVAGRVDASGSNFQFPGPANGFVGNAPYLWSLDIPITGTVSAVTSVDLTYTTGGTATILGVSTQTTGGGAFAPATISGFNNDVIVEANAPHVSGSVTDIVTQVNGLIDITGELWVGNVGAGIYNFSGGTINANNWLVTGRSGGTGTFNMTGGTINKNGGGSFAISTRTGGPSVGTFNQSGGTINSSSEYWIGQGDSSSAGAIATNNVSGTAVMNLTNWLAVGREGGVGVLNISGGTITKTGNGNLTITHGTGAVGIINQTGGSINIAVGDVYIGEDSANGTWNMNGGTALLGNVFIALNTSASGTLNLNGGVFQAHEVISPTTGSTVTILNFNGGTLQANANNATFISGLFSTTIGVNGAVIDSQGFNVTVPQELDDNGGGTLTKLGTGTLTLSGPNTYAGPTVVSAGTLITGTGSAASGAYTVADNAGFGVVVQSANAEFNAASLTLGSSTGASLNFDLDGFGNPVVGAAPLNVNGALTVNGAVTINIADSLPQIGQFPLVHFGALTGSGGFVIGSLPTGIVANLVTNVGNSTIDLNISGVNLPRWEGQAGGNWDIGLTTNWINVGTGFPTFYSDGNAVLFDDNATGTTNVNITTTVSPKSLTVVNSNLTYNFVGSGKISGAVSLVKQGASTLSVLNTGGNNYSGATIISNGVLVVTNLANGGQPSAIGASSASPTNLVINSGATFTYAGAPVTINRGYQANTGKIDTEGDLTLTGLGQTASGTLIKLGPAKMTYAGVGVNVLSPANVGGAYQANNGSVVLDGSAGGQTNTVAGEIWVGGAPATGANLILTNTTLNVGSWLGLGRGNGTVNNVSTLTIYNSRVNFGNISLGYANGIAGNLAQQFMTLAGSTTVTNGGSNNFSESPGSTATVVVKDNAALVTLNGGQGFYLGMSAGATANLIVSNSGSVIDAAWISVGTGSGNGTLTMRDNAKVTTGNDFNVTDTGTSTGTMTIQDNAVASGPTFLVAKSAGTVGTVTMSGGTIIARTGDTQIGGSGTGTMNQTGGTMVGTNWISIGRNGGGTGVYNLSGGTLMKVLPNTTRLNVAENGTGTLNVSGTGAVIVGVGGFADLDVCSASGNGTVNLNGGTITAGQVTHLGGGTATFNFNGGTLVASPFANATFMQGLTAANVLTNGAIIDSGTNAINIGQALLNGAGGGGLTKLGNGTLFLNGANTYTNTTQVSAGALGGTGTIAGPVTVAAGAKLSPGAASIGTLTINNTLTLSGTSTALFRINNNTGGTNNDAVAGLTGVTYGGTLVVTNSGTGSLVLGSTFKLFNSAAAGSGNFSTVTVLPSGSGTFNPATGILTVTSTGGAPVLNHPFISNGNFVLTGTGAPGTGYTLLSTTNIALPLAQWTTNSTGTFDSGGASSNAIPLGATNRFFLLRQP